MPKLSIIVTSFNIKSYIGQCLDSVLAQTFTDTEIIVVDDGSNDGTVEIIQDYAGRDSRIKTILFEKNTIGGVASAANAGLDVATGDYIGFADGDDLYEPEMFAKLMAAVTKNDADLAMCKYLNLNDENGKYEEPAEQGRWAEFTLPAAFVLDDVTRVKFLRFIAVPWRKIYRRSMIEANSIRFPVGDYFFEDNPFHWFSVLSAKSIAVVPEVLCYHRIARSGQTMSHVNESMFKIFIHHDTIRAWLKARGLDEQYKYELLAWAVSQLEWIVRRTPDNLLKQLYSITSTLVRGYNRDEVETMLKVSGKGPTGRALVAALQSGSYPAFLRAAAGSTSKKSLLREGLYRLRSDGVVQTGKTTLRYIAGKVGAGALVGRSGGDALSGHGGISTTDLMFSFAVMQAQMRALQDQLDRIEKKLEQGDRN